jgi:hypothetical protein
MSCNAIEAPTSACPLLRMMSCALTGLELASRQNKAAMDKNFFIVIKI